jgi:hypothetical protein
MVRALPVAAVLAIASVAVAQPTPKERAAEHFKRGSGFYDQGRYVEAIAEFEQAYALVPHVDVLFNIARAYERLGESGKAADYLERYLTERTDTAADADAVIARINNLRERARREAHVEPPTKPPVEPPPPEPNPPRDVPPLPPPPNPPQPSRWHVGASYGIAVGEAPNERYLAHGGIALLSRRLELDAVVGAFGKNDYALGVLGRFVVVRGPNWGVFAHGAATIGLAKQDASSMAGTRFPFGFEAGGGVRYGSKLRLELALLARFVRGGWTPDATTAESFVNDSAAVVIDLGVAVDVPIASGR